jgi:hypothetical protein
MVEFEKFSDKKIKVASFSHHRQSRDQPPPEWLGSLAPDHTRAKCTQVIIRMGLGKKRKERVQSLPSRASLMQIDDGKQG